MFPLYVILLSIIANEKMFVNLFTKHKKTKTTNTYRMSKLSFKRRLAFLLSLPLLFAACDQKKPSVSQPPYQEIERDFPERIPPTAPHEDSTGSETPTVDPEIWDVSDVDISHIDLNRKLIAFTFDDAPKRSLENILAVFASFNESNPDCPASATVFFNGYFFDAVSRQTVHAAYALGFELGNHTQSHLDLTTLDRSALQAEIDQTDALLEKIDGKKRHLLRAPFGKVNELVREVTQTPILDWTIDTLDWTGVSQDDIYSSVYSARASGAIVLMHDGYANTVSALKRLLPDLKADGYQVVSVSQLSKAHECPLKRGNQYIRIRKLR